MTFTGTPALVVVGVNDGAGGDDALALAELLAGPGTALVLAHVWHGIDGVAAAALGGLPPARSSIEVLERARRRLTRACRVVSRESPSVGAGLHRAAVEEHADLLVVGAHPRRAGGAFVTDPTLAALHGAPCSLAVAPQGLATAGPRAIARIGAGWRDDAEGHRALDAARALAATHGAELHVMHVLEPVPTGFAIGPYATLEVIEDVLGERARRARERLSALGDVVVHVTEGNAGEQLTRFSSEVDLLVLGSRGYGPLRRLLFGSSSGTVARGARCPVLVLRRGATTAGPATPIAEAAHRA